MPLVLSNDMNNQHLNKEIANWGGPHLSLFPYVYKSTLGIVGWGLSNDLEFMFDFVDHATSNDMNNNKLVNN